MKPGKEDNRKRILAIDDAAIVLKRITDALEDYYDVVAVNTGSRALRYLETEKPDLILLDIRMMPKDGFETLQEIRSMEDRADIPVIMLTGVEDKNAVVESIRLGIRDYILKPFFPDDLLDRIQRVLGSSEENQGQPSGGEPL
ncbi:response regulator [Colidextribacter sp. OB.20]|uniref:response regulator n=1 Tax=Colidextribacter sp. OB.20 TaxID=2304568 RepID=UPI00136DD41D|nr:response regulator [Colidextribacter sp. OB.20]NBI11541.1 response regulator [Colidextribacter sp. OB.20]